tara:strand:+ start:1325 stop:1711 length:387 start_codon:yes stop_codon:yes gene_type:complete
MCKNYRQYLIVNNIYMFFTIKILKNNFTFTKKELFVYIFFYLLLFFILGADLFIYLIIIDLYIYTFFKNFNINKNVLSKNTLDKKLNKENDIVHQKPKINLEFITEGKYSENEENLSKFVNEYTKNLL